jgi:aryl-alcohol dehydrogenase-like predicted oxidoreductase
MSARKERTRLSRRDLLALALAAGGSALTFGQREAMAEGPAPALRRRPIPHSGEQLPVVGLGTAIVFDVGNSANELGGPQAVVRALVDHGGTLIDTAPSYGGAESVLGSVLTETRLRPHVFLATKLEHESFGDVAAGFRESSQRLRTDKIDLLQLHNVRDPDQDLRALNDLKARGLCRYTGITTTFSAAYPAAESILRRQKPDFIEVDYAIDNPDAEQRVLPAAAEAGTAVLVALPFGRGRLFRAALGKKLPDWAAEIDCHSWAQFFLKWVLGNPAVTAVIPGTDKANHMVDNLGAALGRLPDAAMRIRMARYVQSFG